MIYLPNDEVGTCDWLNRIHHGHGRFFGYSFDIHIVT